MGLAGVALERLFSERVVPVDSASTPIGLYIGIYVGTGIVFGLLSAVVAHVQGRRGVGAAFVIGFLLGIIGLVIVAVMPLSEADKARKAADALPQPGAQVALGTRYSAGDTAVIAGDIVIDSALAFRAGKQVAIARVHPTTPTRTTSMSSTRTRSAKTTFSMTAPYSRTCRPRPVRPSLAPTAPSR